MASRPRVDTKHHEEGQICARPRENAGSADQCSDFASGEPSFSGSWSQRKTDTGNSDDMAFPLTMSQSSTQSPEFTTDRSRSHAGAMFMVCAASLPGDGIGKPIAPIAQQGFDSIRNPRRISHRASMFLEV